jgi:hypothetical protein
MFRRSTLFVANARLGPDERNWVRLIEVDPVPLTWSGAELFAHARRLVGSRG